MTGGQLGREQIRTDSLVHRSRSDSLILGLSSAAASFRGRGLRGPRRTRSTWPQRDEVYVAPEDEVYVAPEGRGLRGP